MAIHRVQWLTHQAIGADREPRSLTMDFGTAKKAAEFAADVVFMVGGRESANAWSDRFYMVGKNCPAVSWNDSARTNFVTVEYMQQPDDNRSRYPHLERGSAVLPT